jgi:hypothetical protein
MTGRLIARPDWPHRFVHCAGLAATSNEKMETCNFGANDQKFAGAARKSSWRSACRTRTRRAASR